MAQHTLITALTTQVDCYRRLAKLTEVQHEFVQQGQTELLLDVLGKRQEMLDQIGSLERVIAPAKGQWHQILAGLDAGSRSQAEKLLAETRALLEQITAADRNDALVLQQRKLNLGKQIVQAKSAKAMNKTYAAAYAPRPTRMDVQR